MDAKPWQCPACKAWIAPHVGEHRCEGDGSAGVREPAAPDPGDPGATMFTWAPGTTTTGMITAPASLTVVTSAAS